MRPSRLSVALAVGALLLLAASATGVTVAAYVSRTSAASTFTAAASFPTFRMATGSYTGDGASTALPIGFQPDVVIIKSAGAQTAIAGTSTMGGQSKPMTGATATRATAVTAMAADGFSIGTDGTVNASGESYRWIALRSLPGSVKVGTYVGNGTAGHAITGVGFQPSYVAILPRHARAATQRFAGASRTYKFDAADLGTTTGVTALGSDGFTLGNGVEANEATQTYHYIAIADLSGSIRTGSYSGTGADNRNVTGLGFAPDFLTVRADDTGTTRAGHMRTGALSGDASMRFSAMADGANLIQALQADGFQVGTDGAVNASGVSYPYLAMRNAGGGCSVQSRQTLTVTADSWTNQGSPSSNHGADSILKVTSKSPSVNTRAFLRFSLPAAPAGCSVTGARLRMYNKSPISGRTLQVQGNAASWTEAGITWANQPAAAGTAVTAATPGSPAWMAWDVTALVQSMYSGSNNGFQVRDQTENGAGSEQQFDSRESGATTPELTLHFGG